MAPFFAPPCRYISRKAFFFLFSYVTVLLVECPFCTVPLSNVMHQFSSLTGNIIGIRPSLHSFMHTRSVVSSEMLKACLDTCIYYSCIHSVSQPWCLFQAIYIIYRSSETEARFPFKRNRLRCVNENRKKRKRLRFLRFSFTQRTQRKRLRLNGNRA